MTKDDYFALVRKNPWNFGTAMYHALPAEWVREAWDTPEVQGEVVPGGIVRNVSKTGSLCQQADYLRWLSATLTESQVVRLYLAIREECFTREKEFRPEFLTAFARHAHAIPPALTLEEIAALLGLTAEEAKAYAAEEAEVHTTEETEVYPDHPVGDDEEIPF